MARAARHGPLAEEAQDHLVAAAILHGEGHAGRQRQVSADDGVAPHESALRIHEMHGAALPLAQPGGSSEELGHDTLRVRAPSKAVGVIAVGREDVVVGPQRDHRSEEHTSELQSLAYLVCRLLLEKKKKNTTLTTCE